MSEMVGDVVQWLKWIRWNCFDSGGRSNIRFQQGYDMAIRAAIRVGCRFPRDAFSSIGCCYAEGLEGYYRLAIESGNRSAAVAVEVEMKRRPFIWDGRRLYVGEEFFDPATRTRWRVNSFAKDQSYLNAVDVTCRPEPEPPIRQFEFGPAPEPESGPTAKRRKWTWDELDQREKRRKAAIKAEKKHADAVA